LQTYQIYAVQLIVLDEKVVKFVWFGLYLDNSIEKKIWKAKLSNEKNILSCETNETMSKIYLFGHKNPDTDAILAPLVYEQFLKAQWKDVEAVKIGPVNKEAEFILDYVGFDKPRRVDTLPKGSKVFLLDHNEVKQSIDNLNELEVVGLIDHHNFGGFMTSKPIYARVEILGCTCSVLYKIFREHGYDIPPKIAKLMISAIISDTLFFRSPITTEDDRIIVKELNEIAKIEDLEKYSLEMFNVKSDLWDIPAEELIKIDFKKYDVGKTRMAIGVMETTNPGYALGRKDEILEAMVMIKKQEELDFILFSIFDILNEINTSFVLDGYEEKVVSDVFGATTNEHLADLGMRISRKKQLVPDLTEYFYNKNLS